MKRIIVNAAAFVVLTGASLSATAQTQPAGARPAAPQPTPVTAAPVPDTKIALVDTTVFGDEKAGIHRYVNALKGVQAAFQVRLNELNNLQNQIKAKSDEITKLNGNAAASAEMIKAKQDEGERLQREWKYKKEQFDADFEKRLTEAVAPISTDIGKALDQYAAQHGLTLILDISKLLPALLTVNPAMDISQAFIADYNSKHP
ncbi:MAG: OmpH family outer membrane protein [bacterium]